MNSVHLSVICMRNLPPLARLRTFEAAARLQSFALAAQELHLTASAISHQIRDLERYFGRALFERSHRQVRTTREGLRLFESLGRVFDALDAVCAEVQLPTQDEVLAVHCAPSLALKWLGPRLPTFLAQHPTINIRLTTGAEPVDLGVMRELDVALSYGAARQKAGLEVFSLGNERVVPLVSPQLVAPGESATEAIERLMLIDSQLSPVGWVDWFDGNGIVLPSRPRCSFDRAAMAIAAAVDGLGVALESTRLAGRELARGDLVVLEARGAKPIDRPLHFVSLRVSDRSRPPIAAFVDWVADQAKDR
ncbi:LysR family transcriptional regulator [Hydrogenophaga crassostreae]|uniref:LysR family transcriptional regulator n=2 Tax=Hydrogenophaga crassostreae TaxID=1763535 RepID=A0A167HY01_9BURK|nr:LysR family transcriptional regulator [Hydrogenophaga crassostreae]OAD41883.1 LysR family transcriptional regulator [Hydrogenophaga crassostreae]